MTDTEIDIADYGRAGKLIAFVRESNAIEGITRGPTTEETMATLHFVELDKFTVADMVKLVQVYQPDALLRDKVGMDVKVGGHIAPKGGPAITALLTGIIEIASHHMNLQTPYKTHQDYEGLHPFTDGNGRSGRALWLWQMERFHGGAPLGFLHHWYYSSLSEARLPWKLVPRPDPL